MAASAERRPAAPVERQEDETMSDGSGPQAASFADAMRLVRGFMMTQALHVAAKLSLCDRLRDGPMNAAELAAAVDANTEALQRLLQFLTTVDVLHEDADGRFRCGPIGEFLRSDHPQSVRALAVMYGGPLFWQPWGDLHRTVLTGEPGFDRVFGRPFVDHLGSDPDAAAIFGAAMTDATRFDLPGILAAYDFSQFARIVDVGGGEGRLLRGILARYPNAHGVLCDLPDVVVGATELTQSEVAARCELVAADIFESVPAAGDLYLLKRILHDWSDADAIRILENVRRASHRTAGFW
jgi:hypothetical protein